MNRKQRRAEQKQGNVVSQGAPPYLQQMFLDAFQLHQAGRLSEAEQFYRQILARDSRHADALHLLGVVAGQTGRYDSAAQLIARAIAINAKDAEYHSNLGNALSALGRLAEAISCFRKAIDLNPDHPMSFNNLGIALKKQGRFDEAITCYRKAINLKPDFREAYNNLGIIFSEKGRFYDAIDCFLVALDLMPDYPEARNNLANALRDIGRLGEAVQQYQQVISLKPDYSNAYYNRGVAFKEQGVLDKAIDSYRKAIVLNPNFPGIYNSLGESLHAQGQFDDAVACFIKALDLKSDDIAAHINLGNSFLSLGRLDDAKANYEKALSLKPDCGQVHSNLVMSLHYSARHSNDDILAQARKFALQVEKPTRSLAFRTTPDPLRRLRIGYVSADFRAHSVAYFLASVLEAHDHHEVEVFCYSNSIPVDAVTLRLREAADHWRSISGVPDAEAAAMIRQDEIDILVDLSGHTDGNRLPLFALKPAPVQVTWLGYSGTTGLSAIDYILADRIVVPPGEEGAFTETVWRLPDCYLCYSPHRLDSPVGPFPAFANGFVTFGSFNNWTKTSPETVATWAAILNRVAGSRLFLKSKSLADPGCRALVLAQFAAHGIGSERLIMEAFLPQAEALAAYNRIDIALDPFPYGGTTTTAEALWMGAPLVTLKGERWVTRVSESILATLGLSDWVAADTLHYVEIACGLAADLPRLVGLRAGLRHRLEISPFCDAPGFARSLEAAFRGMWRDWCEGRVPAEK